EGETVMIAAAWTRAACAGFLGLLVAASTSLAATQEPEGGLLPSYGDGKLAVIGSGFKPGEHVTVTARVAGTQAQFTATADAQGSFRLETDMEVPPGTGVQLQALGDQGTGMAVITEAGPPQGAASGPAEPGRQPSGPPLQAVALALGLALALGAVAFGAYRRSHARDRQVDL